MEISKRIKEFRQSNQLTQKELGEQLNVSDKTISSWETGRTYPDVSMIIKLSDIFDISLDEFLRGDVKIVEKIDKDLRQKKIYKYGLVIGSLLVLTGIIFLNTYQYKNQLVDRFNPFMKMEIGYATLPKKVTYNGGEKYSLKKREENIAQFPDPYKNIRVVNDPFGDTSLLTFEGGQSPEGKNYAMVQHKGLYVRRISFVSWESIPGVIRDNMSKDYVAIPMDDE
ncbi:XRE family transcriptional regulator [Vagococcus penaei]|uniref:XRE family transcriptional regulator n=1 Tax=Vagococcus penaei TaxID=633807 RepID=A0A1Q2D6H4_9ENTE|nr:helix-turn-helix domain-containing protein [Vagococcus penaei]AQP54046.1 XRE family transcriptional regulator [Vagococcus penaei]RSU01721.1 XRE family transcriptional regulator [Vagococcus penaei]